MDRQIRNAAARPAGTTDPRIVKGNGGELVGALLAAPRVAGETPALPPSDSALHRYMRGHVAYSAR
jgi:hypothetical protein